MRSMHRASVFLPMLGRLTAAAAAMVWVCCSARAATIEKLNGRRIRGRIVGETEEHVTVEIRIGRSARAQMVVRKKDIHAITDAKGARRVLNGKDAAPPRTTRTTRRTTTPSPPKPKPKVEWPHFRGPNRNGITDAKGWRANWNGNPPKKVWERQVGGGYSCISVAGGRAYTMGNAGGQDTVWCFKAEDGTEVWKQSYACRSGQYPGPRATPTIDPDGRTVYTLSRKGDLYAWDAATGTPRWNKNVAREMRARAPGWDFAGSVVVEGSLLILNVCSTGMAVNKANGSVAWRSPGSPAGGHATPVLCDIGGRRTALIFASQSLVAVDVRSGARMWSFPWDNRCHVNAADPIVDGSRVFISSGYGKGCALLNVSGSSARPAYQNREMKCHFGSCVLWKGHLYGFDMSTLKCLDFASGSRKWAQRGLGKGTLIMADGKLMILSESGDLVIAEPDPGRYREVCRHKVLGGRCWSQPALAGGRVYARSQQGQAVCVDLR